MVLMSTCIAFQNPIEGPVTNGLSNPYYKDSGMHTVHTWLLLLSGCEKFAGESKLSAAPWGRLAYSYFN